MEDLGTQTHSLLVALRSTRNPAIKLAISLHSTNTNINISNCNISNHSISINSRQCHNIIITLTLRTNRVNCNRLSSSSSSNRAPALR